MPVFQGLKMWSRLAIVAGLMASGNAMAQPAAPDLSEAALLTGGLGKATETQNLGTGYAAGLMPGAGAQLLSKPTITAPAQVALDAKDQKAAVKLELPPLATTQFQKFVQDSTGKPISLYGYSLFDSGRFPAVTDVPAPANYVLGVGDEVDLKIWGVVDMALRLPVDRNGQITVPKVGPVTVAGVQADQIEKHLRTQVGRVFNNFELSATLGRLRTVQVFVVGQARKPGAYMVSSLSTLISALFDSGGPAATGSLRKIALVRQGKTVATLDLYGFIHSGDTTGDARLQAGDVIVIPPAGPRVALQGALDNPAVYELAKPEESLADLLRYSGGLQSLTATHKALVERVSNAQEKAPRTVDERSLTTQGLQSTVRDGDLVTLLPVSRAFANAVTLQGTVAQPLRHAWREGMRVQDLIPDREALITPDYYRRKNQLVQMLDDEKSKDAGGQITSRVQGLVDQINWDYAVVERLNKTELRTELIPFNLAKAVMGKDPQHNLLLQAGDVLTIMGSNDVQLPAERKTRLVRVEGEVAAPGVYQAQPGETLPQLLARVGGLTAQAYVYGAEFTRESVRKQQQQNLDQVIRRLEVQSQSASATLAANLTGERAVQAQALQQQQQQQQQMQAQIARLKALRSKGRVALELDPASVSLARQTPLQALAALPPLPLEDGDAIVVPPLPAFVSAAGSVNNENVMLFKPGKTVGDVIKAAGVSEDGDTSEAFVLRADGSLLARTSTGWFSSFAGTRVMPGDTVIVPPKVDRETGYNFAVRALRDWTQIFSNLGIGAAAIKTLKN